MPLAGIDENGRPMWRRGRPRKDERAAVERAQTRVALQAATAPNGPGGGQNGSGAASNGAATLSARERLAALQRQREANGGWLVAPPLPPDVLSRARMAEPARGSAETLPSANAEYKAMAKWLEAIAAAGGTSADLWLAWQSWNPISISAKHALRSRFDVLDKQAQRAYAELVNRARQEEAEAPETIERQRRFAEMQRAEQVEVALQYLQHAVRGTCFVEPPKLRANIEDPGVLMYEARKILLAGAEQQLAELEAQT